MGKGRQAENLPPLPRRPSSQGSAASNGSAGSRSRKHSTGASNIRHNPILLVPPPPGKSSVEPKNAALQEDLERKYVEQKLDPEEDHRTMDEICKKAAPLNMGKKGDSYLLRRVGDKFYSLGSGQTRLRELFLACDENGDGNVSYDEFKGVLDSFHFGLDKDMTGRLLVTLDKDRSGFIDYDEFMEFFETFQPLGKFPFDIGKDRMMLYAPWEPINAPECKYNLFDKTLPVPVDHTGKHAPGSYEEQKADMEVLKIVATKFSANDSKLRLVFRRFDENRDGTVSLDEFRVGLKKLNMGLTDAQIERFMHICDADGSGQLDYEEFMNTFNEDHTYKSLVIPTNAAEVPDEDALDEGDGKPTQEGATAVLTLFREKMRQNSARARSAFKQFDVNGDGFLSHSELQRAIQDIVPHVTKADTAAVVRAYDPNNDGYLNYREFIQLFEDGEQHPLGASRKLYGRSPLPMGQLPKGVPRPKTADPLPGETLSPSAYNPCHTRTTTRAHTAIPRRDLTSRYNSGDRAHPAGPSGGRSAPPTRFGRTPITPDPGINATVPGCPAWASEPERLHQVRDTATRGITEGDKNIKKALHATHRKRAIERIAYESNMKQAIDDRNDGFYKGRMEHMYNTRRRYVERERLYDYAAQTYDPELAEPGTSIAAKGISTVFSIRSG